MICKYEIKKFRLNITDLAGHPKFHKIKEHYLKNGIDVIINDDNAKREITKEEEEKFIKELGLPFYECSPRNEKVDYIFEELVKIIEDNHSLNI